MRLGSLRPVCRLKWEKKKQEPKCRWTTHLEDFILLKQKCCITYTKLTQTLEGSVHVWRYVHAEIMSLISLGRLLYACAPMYLKVIGKIGVGSVYVNFVGSSGGGIVQIWVCKKFGGAKKTIHKAFWEILVSVVKKCHCHQKHCGRATHANYVLYSATRLAVVWGWDYIVQQDSS